MRYGLAMAAAILSVALPGALQAQEYTFDVQEKLVNITFASKMDVEDIIGTSHKVSGSVLKEASGTIRFEVKVPVASLRTGIDMRDEHLRSAWWLDGESFPEIVFKGGTVKELGRDRYEVAGAFSMHGVEKPLKVVVDASRIPAEKAAKAGLEEVEWLRVRARFEVRLSDHGISIPEVAVGKVNDLWTVNVSLFARSR